MIRYFLIIVFSDNYTIWGDKSLNLIFKKINNICNLNIFIPHAVDPAQPPMNIKKRKKIKENFPHKLKSSVT